MATAPIVSAELRHLGGALAQPRNGALERLHGTFALFAVAPAFDAESAMAADMALTRLDEALEPWDCGRVIPTFTPHVSRAYDGRTRSRLRAVKARVDGDGLFSECW